MILARNEAAPLRFLIAVVVLWVAVRGAMLAGWHPDENETARRGPAPGALLAGMPRAARIVGQAPTPVLFRRAAAVIPRPAVSLFRVAEEPMVRANDVMPNPPPMDPPAAPVAPAASAAVAAIATPLSAPPGSPRRLTGSAWAFVREGSGSASLSPDGQLGGSQAGLRLLYRLFGGVSAAARLSRALAGPTQGEAAVGLDWQPVRTIPLHLMLDRRIALAPSARDAWQFGVAGGFYAVRPFPGVRLDGYAQAGMVGARARDLYADGAVRAGAEIALGGGRSVALGGGAWGAAQPGVARLDVGPSAVFRLPLARTTLAAALDWRGRVAGQARPGSGAALTVGLDF